MPFFGFNESSAHLLARALSQDTGLKVTSTGSIGLPESLLNKERNQYDVKQLLPLINQSISNLREPDRQQLFIGLVKQDLYSSENDWNFVLASNFPVGISIVGAERLVPMETQNKAEAEKIFGARIYKMLKRTIGLQYFGYTRKADNQSVLFSPIMSVMDVDRMSLNF